MQQQLRHVQRTPVFVRVLTFDEIVVRNCSLGALPTRRVWHEVEQVQA